MTSKDTEWSQYSHGNPRGWRRVYRNQLLYAFHDTFTWTCGQTEGKAESFEDAKRQAEACCGAEIGT